MSLDDLHSLRQTSKRMRLIAGHRSQLFYSASVAECEQDGIYFRGVKINGFVDLVQRLSNIDSHEI